MRLMLNIYKVNNKDNFYHEVETKSKQWEDLECNLKKYNIIYKNNKEEKELNYKDNYNYNKE